ncbi:MAG: GNVR domain-containing protein [Pseudomonadota bacterium]
MNESSSPVLPLNYTAVSDENADFIDFLIVLTKYKKVIISVALIFSLGVYLFSITLPDIYKANTKILPPQQSQSSVAGMLNQLGGVVGSAAGGALGIKNPNDLYIGMLTSRSVGDNLIQRFNLEKKYKSQSLESARKTLEKNTLISSGKDSLIAIEVEDKDPVLAADLANAYVEELFKLTSSLAITEASQRRLFFEHQLNLSKNKLAEAESILKNALDNKGVISVDSQSRVIIESMARLRAEISAKEVELGALKASITIDHPEYKRNQHMLDSMRAELMKLESGNPNNSLEKKIGNNPIRKDGLDNIKILRDVKYYEMLYELLAKQYEIARLDESKDSPVIQVLDKAIRPESKIKPSRGVMVVLAFIAGLFLAIMWAFINEALKKSQQSPRRVLQLSLLKSYLSFK